MAWSTGFLLTIAQSGNQMHLPNATAPPHICEKTANLSPWVSNSEQTLKGRRCVRSRKCRDVKERAHLLPRAFACSLEVAQAAQNAAPPFFVSEVSG